MNARYAYAFGVVEMKVCRDGFLARIESFRGQDTDVHLSPLLQEQERD